MSAYGKFAHFMLAIALGLALNAGAEPVETTAAEPGRPRTVLLFYHTYGAGHISAANGIEARIKEQAPDTIVIKKDIRDFWSEAIPKNLHEKLWWFLVNKWPTFFDAAYHSYQNQGRRVRSLDDLAKSYNEKAVAEYISQVRPDSIVSTMFMPAVVAGDLREKGQLRDVPIGWLHTDYMEGFFPRISQRIDMTFLPHPSLQETWEHRGVPADRISVTGMPVNPKLFEPVDREAFLRSKGLDPNVRTIVVASGATGVGDFPLIARKLTEQFKDPVQLVFITAKNEGHFQALTAMKPNLPSNVTMVVEGLVPNDQLLSYVKSSDLYITKAGGLSPTEGFAIGKPMVILDLYGGHEAENARLFESLGLATVNRDLNMIGLEVGRVLGDPALQQRMLEAQGVFKANMDTGPIVDFALHGRPRMEPIPANFGTEGGTPATGTHEALARLERDAPAQVEILLGYTTEAERGSGPYGKLLSGGNPFGHIAIRIGDRVFSSDPKAVRGEDGGLLVDTTLESYLYGTRPPTRNFYWGSDVGEAYARDVLGLRLRGLKPEQVEAMLRAAEDINARWRDGKYEWTKQNNCADQCIQVLEAGGLEGPRRFGPNLPVDVFEHFLALADKDPKVEGDVVAYHQHVDTQSPLRDFAFPLSLRDPLRSLRHFLSSQGRPDALESRISHHITSYPGSTAVHYENPTDRSVADRLAFQQAWAQAHDTAVAELESVERQLGERFTTLRTALGPDFTARVEAFAQLPEGDPRRAALEPSLRSQVAALESYAGNFEAVGRERMKLEFDRQYAEARMQWESQLSTGSETSRQAARKALIRLERLHEAVDRAYLLGNTATLEAAGNQMQSHVAKGPERPRSTLARWSAAGMQFAASVSHAAGNLWALTQRPADAANPTAHPLEAAYRTLGGSAGAQPLRQWGEWSGEIPGGGSTQSIATNPTSGPFNCTQGFGALSRGDRTTL